MDKKELKTAISKLTKNQNITINFRNELTNKSGNYSVLNVKKGKGKGGSLILELVPENGGESIVVGTPQSENILNLIVEGQLTGFESENDVPVVVATNAAQATLLKDFFKDLSVGTEVTLSSAEMSEFNGTFKFQSFKPSKGRYGQIVVSLKTNVGNTIELWTYRHSGAISSFSKVD